MENIAYNKKEAFEQLLDMVEDILLRKGCNDFVVANTDQFRWALEAYNARNLNMTVEEFHASDQYNDYKPVISQDGQRIYTQDYVVLEILRKELGL